MRALLQRNHVLRVGSFLAAPCTRIVDPGLIMKTELSRFEFDFYWGRRLGYMYSKSSMLSQMVRWPLTSRVR